MGCVQRAVTLSSGALESPGLLLSYPIISLA